jgi:hypothetical protein
MALFREAGITPQVRLYLNQLMTAYHMATTGLGATFLTDTLIRMAAPNDHLRYYLLNHPLMQREIFIAIPRSVYHPKAIQAFWDNVAQVDQAVMFHVQQYAINKRLLLHKDFGQQAANIPSIAVFTYYCLREVIFLCVTRNSALLY